MPPEAAQESDKPETPLLIIAGRESALPSADRVVISLFLAIVPVLAHFLISWMGFNPSDEGLFLAIGRRLLDGQIPHRDFESLHPVGSALLHLPLLFAKVESVLWLSRGVVWFEHSAIILLWISIIEILAHRRFESLERCLVSLIALVCSVHSFPIFAWNTVDGLLFAALGLRMTLSARPAVQIAGWIVLGMSYLFKLSFVLLPPLALLVLGQWRRAGRWLAVAVPGAMYLVPLILSGTLPVAWAQLTAQAGLVEFGVARYLLRWKPLASVVLGTVLCGSALLDPDHSRFQRVKAMTRRVGAASALGLPLIAMLAGLATGEARQSSVLLFGLAAGVLMCGRLHTPPRRLGQDRALLLALATAWCASISIGYNWPALMSGPLLVALLWRDSCPNQAALSWQNRLWTLGLTSILFLAAFGVGRYGHTYRERTAESLTRPLGGVLDGAQHLWTNENTYRSLVDLREAIAFATRPGKVYAIHPGVAAHWIRERQRNPLPTDWLHANTEHNPRIKEWIMDVMDQGRDSIIVILQKTDQVNLCDRVVPVPRLDDDEIFQFVRSTFQTIWESEFHSVHEWIPEHAH